MSNGDHITEAIFRAIREEVANIAQEEAELAAKKVEDRVRAKTVEIAATVLEHFSIQKFGSELRIIVDFENTRKKAEPRQDYHQK